MQLFKRHYQNLAEYLKPNKVLVIYGARQVGKTTLLTEFLKRTRLPYRFESGESLRVQRILSSQDFDLIKDYVGENKLIVLDEAQYIPQVGLGLKIIVDQIPGIKVIATGSSSFDLSGQIGEPLTGRKTTLLLYPISQLEMVSEFGKYDTRQRLDEVLIYGAYPMVLGAAGKKRKREILEELSESYLLKDLLSLENIKSPQKLVDLLKLLAFQIGGEVSFNELAGQLVIDIKTVERYLDLLEKTFVIFSLRPFYRNLRRTVRSKNKYYFYDNGIRNALISQFNALADRNDIGELWENFLASERLKKQEYKTIFASNYFWRTWDKQEVDWAEERNGTLHGFEFKWQGGRVKQPKAWKQAYKKTTYKIVDQDNYLNFTS